MSRSRMQVMALLAMFCLAALPVRGGDDKNDVDEIGNRKVAHKSIISEEKEIAPRHPLGATMVSSEGACAAYFNYGRFLSAEELAGAGKV